MKHGGGVLYKGSCLRSGSTRALKKGGALYTLKYGSFVDVLPSLTSSKHPLKKITLDLNTPTGHLN